MNLTIDYKQSTHTVNVPEQLSSLEVRNQLIHSINSQLKEHMTTEQAKPFPRNSPRIQPPVTWNFVCSAESMYLIIFSDSQLFFPISSCIHE